MTAWLNSVRPKRSRSAALLALILRRMGFLLLWLMGASATFAQHLSDKCYVDTQCLERAATTDVSQVRQVKLQDYIRSLAYLQLFDLAHRAMERIDRSNQNGQFAWKRMNDDVAVFEVAAQAMNAPEKIANLAPLETLAQIQSAGSGVSMSAQCWFVVGAIFRRSMWEPREVILAKALRPKVRPHNATLDYLLAVRWPQEIEKLPRNKQGHEWYELSEIWFDLDDHDRAEQATLRAEESGSVDFQGVERIYDSTWRSWLRLGNYARALNAANRASERPVSASFKLQIADSLINAGHSSEALEVIAAALPDVRLEPSLARRLLTLLEVVDLRIAADDTPGAHAVADEMGILADQRDLIPAGQLATAATAFNDLGDHANAKLLLKEAISRLPRAGELLGSGITLGRVTGSTLGLRESLIYEIAVQLYRSGDIDAFDEQQRQLGSWYKARTWRDLCELSGLRRRERPPESACLNGAGSALLVYWAAEAITRGDSVAAQQYLERAIAAKSDLLNAARLADAVSKRGLANEALVAAAELADHLPDPGDREVELARVAATRRQLFP
jgi:tetratricopeptide (TPR) repeat protein